MLVLLGTELKIGLAMEADVIEVTRVPHVTGCAKPT